jgi:hypothetical protein
MSETTTAAAAPAAATSSPVLTATPVLVAKRSIGGFLKGQVISDAEKIAALSEGLRKHFVAAVHNIEATAEAEEETVEEKVDAAVHAALAAVKV